MVLFDTRGTIQKFASVQSILDAYFEVRLQAYVKRKAHWLRVYQQDLKWIQNKVRFIQSVIESFTLYFMETC